MFLAKNGVAAHVPAAGNTHDGIPVEANEVCAEKSIP